MGRSKSNFVGGLQATGAFATVNGEPFSTTSSGDTDAGFLTCTGSGTAIVIPASGTPGNPSGTVTISLAAGTVFPLLVRQVNGGGTATGIVAIYS